MKIRRTLLFLSCIVAFSACQPKVLYTQFYHLPTEGWNLDSILNYNFAVNDTTATYDVLITLRYNRSYPYQNLWMFVDEWQGDTLLHCDTIECYLADEYGRWNGRGINTYEQSLIYVCNHAYDKSGEHRYAFRQGMRTEYLGGIIDLGLTIQYNNGKE